MCLMSFVKEEVEGGANRPTLRVTPITQQLFEGLGGLVR